MDLKQELYDYIKKNGSVSYAELEHFFEQHNFDYKGIYEIYSDVCDKVMFWSDWSKEAIDLINELQTEKKIRKEPCQPIIYLIDGKTINLPIVRKLKDFKTPHWLPTVFEVEATA